MWAKSGQFKKWSKKPKSPTAFSGFFDNLIFRPKVIGSSYRNSKVFPKKFFSICNHGLRILSFFSGCHNQFHSKRSKRCHRDELELIDGNEFDSNQKSETP